MPKIVWKHYIEKDLLQANYSSEKKNMYIVIMYTLQYCFTLGSKEGPFSSSTIPVG